MSIIWKFALAGPGDCYVAMPAGATVLCAQTQFDAIHVWALVPDPAAHDERRKFAVVGTGHKRAITGRYIGTCQLEGGAFVWHVFEESMP
jgi:hypothetical protein